LELGLISRGQIYFANLDPVSGRERAGKRPVLIVSDDAINSQPLVVTVVVGTKASNLSKQHPTNVLMTAKETGLPLDTVFLCFQMRSLDPSRLIDPKTKRPALAGAAPPRKMEEVDQALRLTLSL
jgi:mRNA interferase MazF